MREAGVRDDWRNELYSVACILRALKKKKKKKKKKYYLCAIYFARAKETEKYGAKYTEQKS